MLLLGYSHKLKRTTGFSIQAINALGIWVNPGSAAALTGGDRKTCWRILFSTGQSMQGRSAFPWLARNWRSPPKIIGSSLGLRSISIKSRKRMQKILVSEVAHSSTHNCEQFHEWIFDWLMVLHREIICKLEAEDLKRRRGTRRRLVRTWGCPHNLALQTFLNSSLQCGLKTVHSFSKPIKFIEFT